jgi:hypothetical protein
MKNIKKDAAMPDENEGYELSRQEIFVREQGVFI